MRMCIVCGKRPGVVPDRYNNRSTLCVCRECQSQRLVKDLSLILKLTLEPPTNGQ